MKLYKVLREDGRTTFGRRGWDLPTDTRPGRWRSVAGVLEACENGLHLCRGDQLLDWVGPVLYEVETRGRVIDAGDKMVARGARLTARVETWNACTLRLFAADCAERALRREIERGRTPDPRSLAAVGASRAFARGGIDAEELAAARAAARAAAAAEAAGSAEREWQNARLFEYIEAA